MSDFQYTDEQGGDWISIEARVVFLPAPEPKVHGTVKVVFAGPSEPQMRPVHSVRLPDGREWDALNGWRKLRPMTETSQSSIVGSASPD